MRRAGRIALKAALVAIVAIFIWRSLARNWDEFSAIEFEFHFQFQWILLSVLVVWVTYAIQIASWRTILAGWQQRIRYRDAARARWPWIRRPNAVVPETIHPAFDKAAHLFGVTLKKVPSRYSGESTPFHSTDRRKTRPTITRPFRAGMPPRSSSLIPRNRARHQYERRYA